MRKCLCRGTNIKVVARYGSSSRLDGLYRGKRLRSLGPQRCARRPKWECLCRRKDNRSSGKKPGSTPPPPKGRGSRRSRTRTRGLGRQEVKPKGEKVKAWLRETRGKGERRHNWKEPEPVGRWRELRARGPTVQRGIPSTLRKPAETPSFRFSRVTPTRPFARRSRQSRDSL